MLKYFRTLFLLAMFGAIATGCGSMKVNRIPATMDDTAREGLVLQVPVLHDVFTVMHDSQGERILKRTTVSLPSTQEFYEIDFKGGWLRSRELEVKVNSNGTLKEYSFLTKQKVSNAMASLAEANSEVTTARTELIKAEAEAAAKKNQTSNAVSDENAQLQLEMLNLMLKANLEAIGNGSTLPYPELFTSEG